MKNNLGDIIKKTILATAITCGGVMLYGNSAKEYDTIQNATYKGWTEDEGREILIFNSIKPMIAENSLELDNLEIGQKYDLVVKIPRWGKESVVTATPTTKTKF